MLKHVYKPTAFKKARIFISLTTSDAAKLAGLKLSRLSYIEKGQTEVKLRELVALTRFYGLTAAHLSKWAGEEKLTSPLEPSKRPRS